MEKEIDWYGAFWMTVVYVGVINAIFFIAIYAIYREPNTLDMHIIFSIILMISGTVRGILLPYKGSLEKEESGDNDFYKPPQIVEYVWTSLIVLCAIYLFFIM